MISKVKLYYKALYKNELLKRIEYKVKDIVKYFYIRNKLTRVPSTLKLSDFSLNIDSEKLDIKIINDKNIKIFNDYFSYDDMKKKLNTKKEFWRNIKLNNYDDIKVIWEYNRLEFILPMAVKFVKSNDNLYKRNIIEMLDIWEDQNKYEYSINWNNNLEVAVRAINIVLTLMVLSDDELNSKYMNLLYLHGLHIYNEIDYSNCCIPNNHIIGEATALLLLSKIIVNKECNRWYKKSIKILDKYIDTIEVDGVSKENSFSYQWFVTKMYIFSLCFIEDDCLFKKINDRVNKSLKVLSYIYINKDVYLHYGDNDDGFLYTIYEKYNIIEDVKEYYNYFINNKIGNETLLFERILYKFNNKRIVNDVVNSSKCFCNKKIFVYNDNNNLIFFNAKNIEGHAHNDSLAINLIINGKEVLLDSGTYSYNLDRKTRSYYRGRESHSTILLENNAIEVGTFRWINNSKSYISDFEESDDYIKVKGVIEGIASREIKLYKKINKIEIVDKSEKDNLKVNWIMPSETKVKNSKISLDNVELKFSKVNKVSCDNVMISKEYLVEEKAKRYITFSNKKLITTIEW